MTRALPVRSGNVATTCFTEIAEVAQRKILHFRFLRIRSNVCFCLVIVLFDYHWTQILCEVE